MGGDGDSFGKNFSVESKVEEPQANKLVLMVTSVRGRGTLHVSKQLRWEKVDAIRSGSVHSDRNVGSDLTRQATVFGKQAPWRTSLGQRSVTQEGECLLSNHECSIKKPKPKLVRAPVK